MKLTIPPRQECPPTLDINLAQALAKCRKKQELISALKDHHRELDEAAIAALDIKGLRAFIESKGGYPAPVLDREGLNSLSSELSSRIGSRKQAVSSKQDSLLLQESELLKDLISKCAAMGPKYFYYTVERDDEHSDCFLMEVVASPFKYPNWLESGLSDEIATEFHGDTGETLAKELIQELVRAESGKRQMRRGR